LNKRAAVLAAKVAGLPPSKRPASTPARPTAPAKSTNYGQLLPARQDGPPPSAPPPFKRKPETGSTYGDATFDALLKATVGKAGAQHVAGAVAELQRRGWHKMPKGGWTKKA
jgi:hypothetical protein